MELAESVEISLMSSEGIAAVESSQIYRTIANLVGQIFGPKDVFLDELYDGAKWTIQKNIENWVINPVVHELCSKVHLMCSDYQKHMHNHEDPKKPPPPDPSELWTLDDNHTIEYDVMPGKKPDWYNKDAKPGPVEKGTWVSVAKQTEARQS